MPRPNAGSFTVSALSLQKFTFQTGLQPAHHAGSVEQEEPSTIHLCRGQRMCRVLPGTDRTMSLTSRRILQGFASLFRSRS